MTELIDSAITQLRDPRKGHGPQTIALLANAVKAVNPGEPPKISACFDPHGQPSIEHFKMYLQNITPPARVHVPLALQRNHITGMVIDIDVNGKSDILFFNSLGQSDKGGYAREAQLFMDATRERFPKKNDYFVDRKFQDVSAGDGYCGDWSMWFLRRAATTPSRPLSEVAADFNAIPPSVVPNPTRLREDHINILAQHNRLLSNPSAPTPLVNPVPVELPKIKIRTEAEASTYLENALKSHHKKIDINDFADEASKKQIIKSHLKLSDHFPHHHLKLVGDGVKPLTAEVTKEHRLLKAREIINAGYRSGSIDLDHVHNKEMKKLVLQTFLTEFGPDASKGAPPKFVGHGIVKINLEIMKEKGKEPTPSEDLESTHSQSPGR